MLKRIGWPGHREADQVVDSEVEDERHRREHEQCGEHQVHLLPRFGVQHQEPNSADAPTQTPTTGATAVATRRPDAQAGSAAGILR